MKYLTKTIISFIAFQVHTQLSWAAIKINQVEHDRVMNPDYVFLPGKLFESGDCTIDFDLKADAKEWVNTKFFTGLCKFHSKNRETRISSAADLQAAMKRGLALPQTQVALLVEGLAHCEQMETLTSTLADPSLKERAKFCTSRAMAYNNFNHINWMAMNLEYDAGKRQVDSLLESMRSCEASYLEIGASGFDAFCGIRSPMNEKNFKETVKKASAPLITKYLGPSQCEAISDQEEKEACRKQGAESPLGGMLARKIMATDESIQRSAEKIKGLKEDAGKLNSEFSTLDASVSGILEEIGATYETYKGQVVLAQSVLDESEYWQKGLWQNGSINQQHEYKTDLSTLQSAIDALKAKPSVSEQSPLEKIENAVSMFQQLTSGAEGIRQRSLQLCAVLFCELAIPNRGFASVCKMATQPESKFVCNQQRAAQYCTQQGFDPKYAIFDLKDTQAQAACRNQYLFPKSQS